MTFRAYFRRLNNTTGLAQRRKRYCRAGESARLLPTGREFFLLALAKLALKKTEDGQDALKQAIRDDEADSLDAWVWVAYGMICEQYGFPEAAAVAGTKARSAKASTRERQWA